VSRYSRVSRSLPLICQLVRSSGPSLPVTPKTVTPLSFPVQVGDTGLRKAGAVGSGRILGGDPKGLGCPWGEENA